MKKTLIKVISLVLVLVTLITVIPLTVAAEDNHTCSVTYYKDNRGNLTGIKEIKIDSTTYYDCSSNKKGTIDSPYLYNVLTNNVKHSNNEYSNILSDWAAIAAAIFENGGIYTCCPDDNGDSYPQLYGKNFTNNSAENCYVGRYLADNREYWGGEVGSDCWHSTGLSETNSLDALRSKMASEIAAGVNQKNCSGDYLLTQGTGTEEALIDLKGVQNENLPVLYNMVTSVSRDGSSFKYRYNSYCLAFYDFQLSVIADEDLEYAMESDGSMGELTPEALRKDTTYVATQTNNTGVDSTMEIALENSSSETISTTTEQSTSISFGQSVGIEASFQGVGVSTGFSCEEAFSFATSKENAVTHSEGSTITTSCTVPAYTQAIIKRERGYGINTLSYDVPVALTFNVAVFSMSGDVYADGGCCSSLSTAGYTQRYFYTTFGESNTNAYESLAYRRGTTVKEKDGTVRILHGMDSINGNTHVSYKRHNGASSYDDRRDYDINWENVENTRISNIGTETSISEFANRVPMLPFGAKSTIKCETVNTEIYEFVPLYLPRSIRVTNLTDIKQNVKPRSTINLNRLSIDAFNQYDIPYYGFAVEHGHWEICEGSEDVLKMTPGSNTLTVTGKDGDVGCVQWVLNDDVEYTAAFEQGKATKAELKPVIIQFSVMNDVIM